MCCSRKNRKRKNSLCVKVKFATDNHSPKEVSRCGYCKHRICVFDYPSFTMRRRKFTVGFDCVRATDDAKEYPHFVYKYSPTMQPMSNQSNSSVVH